MILSSLATAISLEADHWFITFQVDIEEPIPALQPGPTVGIDMDIVNPRSL